MGGKRQYCSVIVLSGMVCYGEKLSFLVGIVALLFSSPKTHSAN